MFGRSGDAPANQGAPFSLILFFIREMTLSEKIPSRHQVYAFNANEKKYNHIISGTQI